MRKATEYQLDTAQGRVVLALLNERQRLIERAEKAIQDNVQATQVLLAMLAEKVGLDPTAELDVKQAHPGAPVILFVVPPEEQPKAPAEGEGADGA
jgi:hypothetical protein